MNSNQKECRFCNAPLKGTQKAYCSVRCANKDPNKIKKAQKTCFDRYGVSVPIQNEQIKENIIKTTKERYGTKHIWESIEIRKKIEDTMCKKYGSRNAFKVKEFVEKARATNFKRYGVENPMQLDTFKDKAKKSKQIKIHLIKEKYKKTMLEKYNVEHNFQKDSPFRQDIEKSNLCKYGSIHPMRNDEIKKKRKNTYIRKYGVEHPMKSPLVRKKREQTSINMHGVVSPVQGRNPQSFKLLNNVEWIYNEYVIKEKTTTQIADELNINVQTVCNYLKKNDIVIRRILFFSYKAILWIEFIMEKEKNYIQHAGNDGEYKIPLTNYTVDGYCEKTNTVYEFYGNMWHGNLRTFKPNDKCHPYNPYVTAKELYEKTIKREEKIKSLGYNLVSIWEDEWRSLVEE